MCRDARINSYSHRFTIIESKKGVKKSVSEHINSFLKNPLTNHQHNYIVVLMIPDFVESGNLPPGIHTATWREIVSRFGVNAHRRRLLSGLKTALQSLKNANCQTVYIDGSFVTEKEVPNDFDCCWDEEEVNGDLLDPVLLIFDEGRAAQKAKFLGEFFPAHFLGTVNTIFIDFFQQDKNSGELKGIVSINLQSENL